MVLVQLSDIEYQQAVIKLNKLAFPSEINLLFQRSSALV